jgi:hypothetical protein
MQKLTSPFQLIKKSVDIFSKKENFLFLIQIYIPVAFFSVLSVAQSYLPDSFKNSNAVLLTGVASILQFLYLLTSVLVSAAGIIAIGKIVDGAKFSVKEVFLGAKKSYWKFLLLSILLALMIGFGSVLLIVPGILFLTWYAFSKYIFIEDEKAGILVALGRSKNLVKGKFWKVLGRLAVFGLFMIIVEMALSIIPFGIGTVLASLCGALFILPTYLLYKEISA